MFDLGLFKAPKLDTTFFGIQVIEDLNCLQTWQLDKWTKELMGYEWVQEFNNWAEDNLPKQPTCYMIGNSTLITHPSIIKEIRKQCVDSSKFKYRAFYDVQVKNNPMGVISTIITS